MQSDAHEPTETARPVPSPSAQHNRNVTAFVYGAALVVLFLLGLPCVIVSVIVSDRSLANTTLGAGLALIALGMAGLGLSSAALYRHPDWQLPALFAFVPDAWLGSARYAYSHGERTFPLAWFGCISAVAATVAALVMFAYPLVAVPAAFWLGEGALFIFAFIPSYMARLRAWRRTPSAH